MGFYTDTLNSLIASGDLDPAARTLVVAGGETDRDALLAAGFGDVTVSNLDDRLTGNEFEPFAWSFQDAEALTYADGSFAQVLVHAGLHHCASPHRALTEMYRVASRSVLAFEARDSALMRLGRQVGLTGDHEIEAVVANGFILGGWRNTAVPNFVYRWTEREVRKTLASYDPRGPIFTRFFYGLRLPTERLAMGAWLKRATLAAMTLPIRAVFALAPGQGNSFAFYARKPIASHPWLKNGLPDREWLNSRYKTKP